MSQTARVRRFAVMATAKKQSFCLKEKERERDRGGGREREREKEKREMERERRHANCDPPKKERNRLSGTLTESSLPFLCLWNT